MIFSRLVFTIILFCSGCSYLSSSGSTKTAPSGKPQTELAALKEQFKQQFNRHEKKTFELAQLACATAHLSIEYQDKKSALFYAAKAQAIIEPSKFLSTHFREKAEIQLSLASVYAKIDQPSLARTLYQRSLSNFSIHAKKYSFDEWRLTQAQKQFSEFEHALNPTLQPSINKD